MLSESGEEFSCIIPPTLAKVGHYVKTAVTQPGAANVDNRLMFGVDISDRKFTENLLHGFDSWTMAVGCSMISTSVANAVIIYNELHGPDEQIRQTEAMLQIAHGLRQRALEIQGRRFGWSKQVKIVQSNTFGRIT